MAEASMQEVDDALLPPEYDRLVPVEQLVHGEHNPRKVAPTEELQASIADTGIQQPLIVRPDRDHKHRYHVTDGWQRYQAATDCGWEVLPVRIFESPLAALQATETTSIVREWSKYEWAQYCRSVAAELTADSRQALAEQVAARTTKSPPTVRRYLDVLSLPRELHPLLIDGPEGREQDWAALRNYNEQIRRYEGMRWTVASHLARRQDRLCVDRTIGIAAFAVEFETGDDAMEFIDCATDDPEKQLATVRKEVLMGQKHPQMLEIPRTVVSLDPEQKQAVMEHCRQERQPLQRVVAEHIKSLAEKALKD